MRDLKVDFLCRKSPHMRGWKISALGVTGVHFKFDRMFGP